MAKPIEETSVFHEDDTERLETDVHPFASLTDEERKEVIKAYDIEKGAS